MFKLIAACLLMSFLSATSYSATLDRSRPNVYGEHPTSKWSLGSVTVDSRVQHLRAPAFRVRPKAIFHSPPFEVKPNTTYSCVVDFRGDTWPSTSLRFSLAFYRGGKHLSNANTASTWMYRHDQVGEWREAVNVFKTPPTTNRVRLLMSRFEDSNPDQPTLMSSAVYCHEGNYWDGGPDPKIAFDGSKVKVTHDGLLIIDGKPEFLRCMFLDSSGTEAVKAALWPKFAANGWNCNMWAPNEKNLRIAAEAGIPYGFLAIAPYFHNKSSPPQRGWAYGQLDKLESTLKQILRSPRADNLVGYYFDDESHGEYALKEKIVQLIDRLDRDANGKRQRPMYFLEGNSGAALQHMHHMDMVGTYAGGNTGGAGSGSHSHELLKIVDGMTKPVVFIQINRKAEASVERIKLATTVGATALGYWRTNGGDYFKFPWARNFPSTVATILANELQPRFDAFDGNIHAKESAAGLHPPHRLRSLRSQ